MLLVPDKIFLALVFLYSSPALYFSVFVLSDFTLTTVFCVYALFSVRLVSSNCYLIKSLGYGVASAPILLFVQVHDGALGGEVPTLGR